MTSHYRSRNDGGQKAAAYENFMGLDVSRPETNQDAGGQQVLRKLSGGYCDDIGQIIRAPGYYRLKRRDNTTIDDAIAHTVVFAEDEPCWAYVTREGIGFDSVRAHRTSVVWPSNAQIASTVFNGKTVFVARGLEPQIYDGYIWDTPGSDTYFNEYKPSYITTVENRMVIAGIPLKPTELHFSATNQIRFYNETTDASDEAVTRPGFIDIQNLITRTEKITGLAPFETSRLAVFTQDRMLLYNTNADLTKWAIDQTANVKIGCISHNTIQSAGTDLIFCSRTGVHSVSRSRENGILVFSRAMSDRVKRLYRSLVDSVEDPTLISAVWDQDNGQYHILFPQASSNLTKRLTLSLNPSNDRSAPKWSLTEFLNETCGDFMGGMCVFGTSDGLYQLAREEDEGADTYPDLEFETPLLWHGDIVNKKATASILFQVAGRGTLTVTVTNEAGRDLWSHTTAIDAAIQDDGSIPQVPLVDQYDRPFETEYRGARFNFKVTGGKGLLIVSGFAVYLKVG